MTEGQHVARPVVSDTNPVPASERTFERHEVETERETFRKTVRLGTTKTYGGRTMSIFCQVEYDGARLSISGVEGPLPSGNCLGSCGQIDTHLRNDQRSITLAPGWTRAMLHVFLEIWERWHLNDLRAECQHQRELGWTYDTHPSAECPTCGYKLGSAWLTEQVPDEVIAFLDLLPDADRRPAWV